MKTSACAFILAILVSGAAFAEQPAELIGHIQNMTGTVTIQRNNAFMPGAPGIALYRSDIIKTGKPGAAGIVLTDDTTVSLGSGSELSLKDFAFDPKEGKFALALRMIKGTFSYISGQIAKLAPDTAKLETPDATIAVRGTKLLVQVND